MREKFKIVLYVALLCISTASCKAEDEYNTDISQRERIVKYLDGLDQRYETFNDIYRLKLNVKPSTPGVRVNEGDSVWLNYAIYTFDTKPDSLVTTNIAQLATEWKLSTDFLSLVPLDMIYGEGKVFKGWEQGMQNSISGDSMMIFVPSDLAYGDKINGIVKKSTTIAIFVAITESKSNQ